MASGTYLRSLTNAVRARPVIPVRGGRKRKAKWPVVIATVEGEADAGAGVSPVRIDRNGVWLSRNGPITRRRVVKLYAKALVREGYDRYCLVAPCERIPVDVEDAPFVGVQVRAKKSGRNQVVQIRTNIDEEVVVNREHPLRFACDVETGGFKPYVLLHNGLEARLTRSAAIELTGLAVVEHFGGMQHMGIWSSGVFFPVCALDAAEGE